MGATASGKTYFINEKYKNNDADILNIYDYQQRAYEKSGFGDAIPFGANFRCLMNANNMLLEDIKEKLVNGRDVVVEQTFYKAKRRIAYVDEIRKISNVMIEIYVISPAINLWKSNLEKRDLLVNFESFKNQIKEIEFPNPAEGFDRIYEVIDGTIRLRMESPRPEILEPAREELRKEAERISFEDEEKRKRNELLESMNHRAFWHYCEVCGKKEYITAEEAYQRGWDYPPKIGYFGLLGPRTCGGCQLKDTLYWKVTTQNKLPIVLESKLTPEEKITWNRIKEEPESLLL